MAELSPRSTLKMIEARVPGKKHCRSVRFENDDCLVVMSPQPVTLSQKEISSLWYSQDEYRLIKSSQFFTVQKMESDELVLNNNDEDICTRGLESRTVRGRTRRQRNINCGWDCVLAEQDKQYETGLYSTTALAKAYRDVSAKCSMAAYLVAMRDKEYADEKQKAVGFPKTESNSRGQVSVSRHKSPLART